MGMYTEIFVKIEFKTNLPAEVVTALKWLDGQEVRDAPLPGHPFFKLHRAAILLQCCSYYHQPDVTRNLWFDDIGGNWYLCSRSDIKNYEGEIEAFFDWVKPYCSSNADRTFIGYHLYEEDNEPTLVYVEGDQ